MAVNRIHRVPGRPWPGNTGEYKGARALATGSARAGGGDRVEWPEVRDDRVQAVRKALRTGTYQVDARRLARAILEFEREFGG